MFHEIPTGKHGPLEAAMTRTVQACVHCGFCLAACPTYRELGQEMDTPRGRIVLMKQVLEGSLAYESAQPHVDRCLGCLACEPACPSGVRYRDLINPFRALARSKLKLSNSEKMRRRLLAQLMPFPGRFRFAAQMGIAARHFPSLIPRRIQPMLALLPTKLPSRQ